MATIQVITVPDIDHIYLVATDNVQRAIRQFLDSHELVFHVYSTGDGYQIAAQFQSKKELERKSDNA